MVKYTRKFLKWSLTEILNNSTFSYRYVPRSMTGAFYFWQKAGCFFQFGKCRRKKFCQLLVTKKALLGKGDVKIVATNRQRKKKRTMQEIKYCIEMFAEILPQHGRQRPFLCGIISDGHKKRPSVSDCYQRRKRDLLWLRSY